MPLASVGPADPRFLARHPRQPPRAPGPGTRPGHQARAPGAPTAAPCGMDAAFVSFQHTAAQRTLIIGSASARPLALLLVPVGLQRSSV